MHVDDRATKKGDFVAGAKVGSVASPAGASNVARFELKNVHGAMANQVYRYETAGGVAPSSVTPFSATCGHWLIV